MKIRFKKRKKGQLQQSKLSYNNTLLSCLQRAGGSDVLRTYARLWKRRIFKAIHLLFLPNFPDPTFIPCPTSIPEARVAPPISFPTSTQKTGPFVLDFRVI